MISLLVFSTLVRYAFTPETRATYEVSVGFDGYLPVVGGRQAKVDLAMVVNVEGRPADDEGRPQVASEIRDFKMSLNGAAMPFTAKNVADFFPRTTVSISPEGKQLKTDAPDKKLPVRLPGLDIKRFPDITYLPIEFPAEGIEEGKPFRFKKPFGDSEVEYEVTPTAVTEDAVTLKVHLSQSYIAYEDQAHNPVEESAATTRVATDVAGDGTATFDRRRGLIKQAKVTAVATGHAIDLATKAQTDRQLKTTLTILLRNG